MFKVSPRYAEVPPGQDSDKQTCRGGAVQRREESWHAGCQRGKRRSREESWMILKATQEESELVKEGERVNSRKLDGFKGDSSGVRGCQERRKKVGRRELNVFKGSSREVRVGHGRRKKIDNRELNGFEGDSRGIRGDQERRSTLKNWMVSEANQKESEMVK